MRTPGDDKYLAVGLLYTEDILQQKSDLLRYRERPCLAEGHFSVAELEIPDRLARRQKISARTLLASSSCGLCGKTDASGMNYPQEPLEHNLRFDISRLGDLLRQMQNRQPLFQATGGCHAAAAFTTEGKLLSAMEDIGRHNAVDKVIGYLLTHDLLDDATLILVSGRVSYEIVTKLYVAGIPFLASVSAPSTLAVELCNAMGMTLLSFCRGNKATVYSHDASIVGAVECASST